jgi:hypothetical protein
MAGYDPKRPRPTEGPPLVGLPGDPAPEPAHSPPVAATAEPSPLPTPADLDPVPAPSGRVTPRTAPPLDRRLPVAAFVSGVVAALAMLVLWRRWRRRE